MRQERIELAGEWRTALHKSDQQRSTIYGVKYIHSHIHLHTFTTNKTKTYSPKTKLQTTTLG